MAGLLNLLADRYFQQQDAEQYRGLLDRFPTQLAGPPAPTPYDLGPDQAGPFDPRSVPAAGQPGGGILADRPAEFYLQAGAIPAYRQMAMQAQVGQQAMARQMQEQDWSSKNMTAAQNATLAAQAARDKWQQDFDIFNRDNLSAYQQANIGMQGLQLTQQDERARQGLGIQQAQLGISQEEARQRTAKAQAEAANPLLRLNPTEQTKVLGQANTMQQHINTLADIETELLKDGGAQLEFGNPRARAMNQAFRAAVLPYALKAAGATEGAEPGPKVVEAANAMIPDLTAIGSKERKQKAVQMWMDTIRSNYQPLSAVFGGKGIEAQPGQSVFARSFPTTDVVQAGDKKLKPWKPITGGQ